MEKVCAVQIFFVSHTISIVRIFSDLQWARDQGKKV